MTAVGGRSPMGNTTAPRADASLAETATSLGGVDASVAAPAWEGRPRTHARTKDATSAWLAVNKDLRGIRRRARPAFDPFLDTQRQPAEQLGELVEIERLDQVGIEPRLA